MGSLSLSAGTRGAFAINYRAVPPAEATFELVHRGQLGPHSTSPARTAVGARPGQARSHRQGLQDLPRKQAQPYD